MACSRLGERHPTFTYSNQSDSVSICFRKISNLLNKSAQPFSWCLQRHWKVFHEIVKYPMECTVPRWCCKVPPWFCKDSDGAVRYPHGAGHTREPLSAEKEALTRSHAEQLHRRCRTALLFINVLLIDCSKHAVALQTHPGLSSWAREWGPIGSLPPGNATQYRSVSIGWSTFVFGCSLNFITGHTMSTKNDC